ncbi:MAG: RHS repeat-associated core domain-containing protein [Chromatiales bacterium]
MAVSAVAGLGLSWSLIKAQCAGRGNTRVELWQGQGQGSGSGAVTATLASAPSNAVIAVSRYAGVSALGNLLAGNTLGANGACAGGTDSASYSFNLTTTVSGTDANQTVVWAADYEPFGQATLTTEAVVNPLRFPGQYYDAETGLHYNYFRDYDPSIGRYIQSDPIGLAGGLNTYLYANANPLRFTDPMGLAVWICTRSVSGFDQTCIYWFL